MVMEDRLGTYTVRGITTSITTSLVMPFTICGALEARPEARRAGAVPEPQPGRMLDFGK
jgi:hypothetical protein